MNKLVELISHSIAIKAFAISLLHSLWQGVAIAMLLWTCLKVIKEDKAQIRYKSSLLGLLILLRPFAPLFTTSMGNLLLHPAWK